MIKDLKVVLKELKGSALCCFNVFGVEDAKAVIEAAEEMGIPVALSCNKTIVDYMGVKEAGLLFSTMAENSKASIVVHLDHTYEESQIEMALDCGYSSFMFDGSQLPLKENIKRTKKMADLVHERGWSLEGEIGSVPYQEGRDHIKSLLSDPEEVAIFEKESGVDALAISIGNIHRMSKGHCEIDFQRFQEIKDKVNGTPLVIHGTTGIKEEDLIRLKEEGISKFNIGTDLRKAFGESLRNLMSEYPNEYDRLFFLEKTIPYIKEAALRYLKILG